MVFGNKESFEIKYDEKGIARLDFPRYYRDGLNHTVYVERNKLREGLDSILENGENYFVSQVFINPDAREELKKYVGKGEWKGETRTYSYRKAKKKDEYRLGFNPQLKESYFYVLNQLMNSNLDENNFIHFSNIKEDAKGGWPTIAKLLGPQTYAIKNKGDNILTFHHLIKNINADLSYELLKKREHPQNYHMAEIEILRERHIDPLIIGDKSFEINSEILKNLVNFFVPFNLVHKSFSGCADGDL